jgi:IclR family pca regulon transcriptional regulator
MADKTKVNISETLDKGLKILDLFCGEKSSYSLSDMSRRLGVNKTSVYRFVNTLCEHGYLQKDEKNKFYTLGIRTIPLAHSFLQKAEIVGRIKPFVDEIHKEYDLHIDVGLIQNNHIYLVYRRESKDTLAFLHFTAAADLHTLATGKAAMAFMAEEQLPGFLDQPSAFPATGKVGESLANIRAELVEIRAKGYSVNRERFLPGLISLGAPVFNVHDRKVLGGVSFDSSTARFSMEEFEQRYASLLVELAKKLSASISG